MLRLWLHPAPSSQNSEPLWDSTCFCMKTICLIAVLWFMWYISNWSLHPKTSNLENQGSSHMYLSNFMLWDCSSSRMLCVGINALLSRFLIHSEINRKNPWEHRERTSKSRVQKVRFTVHIIEKVSMNLFPNRLVTQRKIVIGKRRMVKSEQK